MNHALRMLVFYAALAARSLWSDGMALQPVAFSNRVGTYIVGGGSSTVATRGNVSTSLIGMGETWADVLNHAQVTVPVADGVRSVLIRCPRGTWVDDDGNEWANHCNANGTRVPTPAPMHALYVAQARGETRLTNGYGTFLAGLQAQGMAITSYNSGTCNVVAPASDNALSNWQADPLTQTGYTTIAEANDNSYIRGLYADELDYGCTEFAFDANGQDRSTGMVSTALYPKLASVTPGFNEYARWVASEAACLRSTGAWQSIYGFCESDSAYHDRLGDSMYLQPSEMARLPCVIVQDPGEAGYYEALSLAPYLRVRVKWQAMKATMGSAAMVTLLAAGDGDVGSTAVKGAQRPTRNWRRW